MSETNLATPTGRRDRACAVHDDEVWLNDRSDRNDRNAFTQPKQTKTRTQSRQQRGEGSRSVVTGWM